MTMAHPPEEEEEEKASSPAAWLQMAQLKQAEAGRQERVSRMEPYDGTLEEAIAELSAHGGWSEILADLVREGLAEVVGRRDGGLVVGITEAGRKKPPGCTGSSFG
jgi:hypothetical protein